jgi:hypothetical protein
MTDKTFNLLRIFLISLLIVWGGYTFIEYLAVPAHQAVLLSGEGRAAVADACPSGGSFCQGFNAIIPFMGQTFTWATPFFWYAILSLVVLAGIAGYQYMQSNRWHIRLRLTPLYVILAFIASLWLTFTVISMGKSGLGDTAEPFSRLYEPSPQIYEGAGPEGLEVLKDNFDRLMDNGCLTQVGTVGQNIKAYNMSYLCMQTSFFTRVLPHVGMVLFLMFVFLTFGRFLLGLFKAKSHGPLVEMIFSLGLGSCGLIVVLWLLALIGGWLQTPIYSMVAGWALLLVIPAALYNHARYWLEALYKREWTYEGAAYTGSLIIGWLLISYLALNFLNVVRPFPIGWDDLGKYVNQPRLLVSYGFFIPQLASFLWEYITSLGFLLFGYESVFGATAAMMFNWAAGLLATLTVYAFGRIYLGPRQGLLAALLYYTLPLVGHFSYADMKVDNAVFAIGALSMLAAFIALFPTYTEEELAEGEEAPAERAMDWRWIVIAGVLGGFAFSMKPTSIMTVMAIGTILYGAMVHWTAFLGTLSLAFAVFGLEGRLNITEISTRVYGNPDVLSKPLILGALLVLGVGLSIYSAIIRPAAFKRTSIAAGVFIASFIVTILPWLLSNNIGYGNVVPRLVFTAPNNLGPTLVIGKDAPEPADYGQDIRRLPAELQVDESKCVGSAKTEELDRYWGYGSGWGHYLTLPWRTVMNIDSGGYYVTTIPALLLFPLILLLPFFWVKQGRWLRWLFFGTLFLLVQWMFFANGIPWYGIGTFLGLVIGLEALVYRAPDPYSKTAAGIFIGLSLMTAYGHRFWQYDQQRNLFEYSTGKVSYEAMRERTIPHYDDIRDVIEERAAENPERPYVYRIGTFIPYFLPRNLEVLPVADHQVDFFNCLHQERDPAMTLKRLQALGFNSIIFDTNTHTIEQDPNGSLHKKVQMFVDFINTPGLGINVVLSDVNNGIAFILLP